MKVTRISCLIILFCLSICCFTQKLNADSLQIEKLLTLSNKYLIINPDSSNYFAEKALKMAQAESLRKYISIAEENIGNHYKKNEDFAQAMKYYLDALKIEEQMNNDNRIAALDLDIGYLYLNMEKFQYSMQFYNNAKSIYSNLKDTTGLVKSILQISWLYASREYCEPRTKEQKQEDVKTAISCVLKAKQLSEKSKNEHEIAICNSYLGEFFNKLKQPDIALRFLLSSQDYFMKSGDWENKLIVWQFLGITYNQKKNYGKSIECLKMLIDESKRRNFTEGLQYIYESLAQTYDNAHDYKNARDYYVKYMILRDSIYNATKSKQVFELERKFQSEKKEKEILALKLEKKSRTFLISILTSIIVFLILFGLSAILRIRSKRFIAEQALEIKEQKIMELEKEHLLVATQSVLAGEEIERQRIARDLHDGLGGLLSGIKLSLNNLRNKIEHHNEYEKALILIDTSTRELRRIAHNMMPESLVKLGLKDAVGDFCHSIEESCSIKIQFQYIGNFKRVEHKLEIGIYRILQELLNNSVKHSGANELLVQIIQEGERLCLIVQDNGKGFDLAKMMKNDGMGLKNVRSRVESLNGRIDICSEPGKGTEFNIEF